jgi:hypothetical protein
MADGSATVSTFPNVPVDVSVTTNAPRTQRATIVIDGNTSGPFTGSSERNVIGRDSTNSGSGNVRLCWSMIAAMGAGSAPKPIPVALI